MFEPYKILENIRELPPFANVLEIGVGTCKNIFAILATNSDVNIFGCDLDTAGNIERTTSFHMNGFDFFTPNIESCFRQNGSITRYELYKELSINMYNTREMFCESELNIKLSNVIYDMDYRKYLSSLSTELKFELIILARLIHYEEIDLNNLFASTTEILSINGSIFISYPISSGRRNITENQLLEILEANRLEICKSKQENDINFVMCKRLPKHNKLRARS